MTARSLGEILQGREPAKVRRTYEPVRRNSFDAKDRRASALWGPIAPDARSARRLIAARLKAAEHYNERNKQAGDRQGPIGDVGIRLLRELYRIVDYRTGRLDPAIDTLCDRVKRARATVVKYLAKLREHGFLNWVRRTEPTDNEGAGPQVRQITNAYGLLVPAHAAVWITKVCGDAPLPDDDVVRRAEAEAERKVMENSLPPIEFVAAVVDNPQLAEILSKMAARLPEDSASSISGQNPDQVYLYV